MTNAQIPTLEELEAFIAQMPATDELVTRFAVYRASIVTGMADEYFGVSDPEYLQGIKDTIEFLATGRTPKYLQR